MVIEPASNNEGEEDHDTTSGAEAKEAAPEPTLPSDSSEQKVGKDSEPAPSAPASSEASQDLPPGFLYKVSAFFYFVLLLFAFAGHLNFIALHEVPLLEILDFPCFFSF